MFGDVVDPSIKVGTKQWYTVPLSILATRRGFSALVVIPLLATDVLPTPQSVMAFVARRRRRHRRRLRRRRRHAAAPPPPVPVNVEPERRAG